MKRILLVMHRRILSEAITSGLKAEDEIEVLAEYSFKQAEDTNLVFQPDTILLEIPESGEFTPARCMNLCKQMKENNKACKIIVLCPENYKEACSYTKQALQNRQIQDFVYYDTSMRYLIAKLTSL